MIGEYTEFIYGVLLQPNGDFVVTTSDDGTGFHERIVRCRDCKFSINGGMQCKRHKDSGWNGNTYCEEYAHVDPDGYCAWGVER